MKKILLAIILGLLIAYISLPVPGDRFVKVVDKVMPAVVEIHVVGYRLHPLVALLDALTGEDNSNNPELWIKVGVLGSGVYVTSNGYILTVAHLFNGFKKIESVSVIRPNGDTVAAEVKQVGKGVDLAIIRTTYYKEVPYVKLADPRELRVGQEVIAIGSPAGLSFSVSNGIISALYRDFEFAYNVTQSNTAINPGNSGGPLFNLKGELVGINSFFILADRNLPLFSGLGFSVQSGQCLEFVTAAKKKFPDLRNRNWRDTLSDWRKYAIRRWISLKKKS